VYVCEGEGDAPVLEWLAMPSLWLLCVYVEVALDQVWMEFVGSCVAEHTCSRIFCQRQVDSVHDLQGIVHSRLE
jgi:hypothetical protein